jgi:hypothetical protein
VKGRFETLPDGAGDFARLLGITDADHEQRAWTASADCIRSFAEACSDAL